MIFYRLKTEIVTQMSHYNVKTSVRVHTQSTVFGENKHGAGKRARPGLRWKCLCFPGVYSGRSPPNSDRVDGKWRNNRFSEVLLGNAVGGHNTCATNDCYSRTRAGQCNIITEWRSNAACPVYETTAINDYGNTVNKTVLFYCHRNRTVGPTPRRTRWPPCIIFAIASITFCKRDCRTDPSPTGHAYACSNTKQRVWRVARVVTRQSSPRLFPGGAILIRFWINAH